MTKGFKKILAVAVCGTVLVSGLAFTGAAMANGEEQLEDASSAVSLVEESVSETGWATEDTDGLDLQESEITNKVGMLTDAILEIDDNSNSKNAVEDEALPFTAAADGTITPFSENNYSYFSFESTGGGRVTVYNNKMEVWATLEPDNDTMNGGSATPYLYMEGDGDVFYALFEPEEGMVLRSIMPEDYPTLQFYSMLTWEKTYEGKNVLYKFTYNEANDTRNFEVPIICFFWVDVQIDVDLDEQYTYLRHNPSALLRPDVVAPDTDLVKTSFQWYSSVSGTTSDGVAIPGANSMSYVPPTDEPGIFYYYLEITATHQNYPVIETILFTEVTRVKVVNPLHLTPEVSPKGAGIIVVKGDGQNLQPGGSIEMEARAAEGYTFAYWQQASGDGQFSTTTNIETTYTFGEKDATITAVFAADEAEAPVFTKNLTDNVSLRQRGEGTTLAVEVKEPSDGGTLTYAWYKSDTLDGEGTQVGVNPYSFGTSLAIDTEEPGTAYYYVEATNTRANGSTAKTKSTVTKIEVLPTYELHVLGGDSEKGTVGYNAANAIVQNGEVYLAAGDEVEIWAEANPGFVFVGWAVNAEIDLQGNQNEARFQFTMQEEDLIVVATFAAAEDAVTPKIAEIDLKDFHLAVQGDKIVLEIALQNESELADVGYSWYRVNPDSVSGRTLVAQTTVGRVEVDTTAAGTYSYYVEVTNEDTSATGSQRTTATSPTITVVLEQKLAMPALPETIRVGDKFTLNPNVEGAAGIGENGWIFDDEMFGVTFNSPATFTAMQTGTTTITFETAAGQVWSAAIQIDARVPATESAAASSSSSNTVIAQTGDIAVPHLYLALMLGVIALLGTALLVFKKSRSNPF